MAPPSWYAAAADAIAARRARYAGSENPGWSAGSSTWAYVDGMSPVCPSAADMPRNTADDETECTLVRLTVAICPPRTVRAVAAPDGLP